MARAMKEPQHQKLLSLTIGTTSQSPALTFILELQHSSATEQHEPKQF